LSQQQLAISGHSFEARIYAEDPFNDFLPTAGKVTWLEQPPATEYVRVDSAVVVRDEVGVFYDPMIAKLIVWGEDRATALQRLHSALAEYRIAGVTTNIDFLRRLSAHSGFREAQLSTDFIERHAVDLLHSDGAQAQTFAVLACLYEILAMRQDWNQLPVADTR
jgi:3-methylcrotonyl-CoA carboxylase alpha subunit